MKRLFKIEDRVMRVRKMMGKMGWGGEKRRRRWDGNSLTRPSCDWPGYLNNTLLPDGIDYSTARKWILLISRLNLSPHNPLIQELRQRVDIKSQQASARFFYCPSTQTNLVVRSVRLRSIRVEAPVIPSAILYPSINLYQTPQSVKKAQGGSSKSRTLDLLASA